MRRQVVENMESRKLAMISGLYANTNLDDGKKTRQKMISDLDENFKEAIARLYEPAEEKEENELENNPFFEAMNVPGGDVDWSEYAENNSATDLDQDLMEDIEVDQA